VLAAVTALWVPAPHPSKLTERVEVLVRDEPNDDVGPRVDPLPLFVFRVLGEPVKLWVVEEHVVVGLFEAGLRFFVRDVEVVCGVVFEEVAAVYASG
jgi:hypothetical protein